MGFTRGDFVVSGAKKKDEVYYLSGPMTGYENCNHAAFENAAGILRDIGLRVVSPHELISASEGERIGHKACMKIVLAAMLKCDVVVLLHNWLFSEGARREANVADWTGLRVVGWSELLMENGFEGEVE